MVHQSNPIPSAEDTNQKLVNQQDPTSLRVDSSKPNQANQPKVVEFNAEMGEYKNLFDLGPRPNKKVMIPVPPSLQTTGTSRTFETGATRDTDANKHDPEGFLSPLVLERFDEYMHKNRFQSDGKVRDSDNWQKGIPLSVYMKSMYRHFLDVWKHHRGFGDLAREGIEEALCGLMFNVQGYLHEVLMKKRKEK